MSKVTFKATSTAIVLLQGKGRHQQLSCLPSINHLLDMALYPVRRLPSISADSRLVTLEMSIQGDNGIYATAKQKVAISNGVVPDINLPAYQISMLSSDCRISEKDRQAMIKAQGGSDMFKSYEIDLIMHVEQI